jgi:hypothetical protein
MREIDRAKGHQDILVSVAVTPKDLRSYQHFRLALQGEKMKKFSVTCPHCTRGHDDPFEVMSRGTVDSMRCSACHLTFHFLIAECESCEHENVFVWTESPDRLWVESALCEECGTGLEVIADVAVIADQLGRGE